MIMVSCSNHDNVVRLGKTLVFQKQNSNEIVRLEKIVPFNWYDSVFFLDSTRVDCRVLRNDTLDLLLIEETIQEKIPSYRKILYYEGNTYHEMTFHKMCFINDGPYISKGLSFDENQPIYDLDDLYTFIDVDGINYQSQIDSNAVIRFIFDTTGKVVFIDTLFSKLCKTLDLYSDYCYNYYLYGTDTIVMMVTFFDYPLIDKMVIPFYYWDEWNMGDITIEYEGEIYCPYKPSDEKRLRESISCELYPILDGVLMKENL